MNSPWFAQASEDTPASPLEVHLVYSGLDFALSHELGHRLRASADPKFALDVGEERQADLLGFRLYAASWDGGTTLWKTHP
jgi:hypothetical protein